VAVVTGHVNGDAPPAALTLTRPEWHERAACANTPTDTFFPDDGCGPTESGRRLAAARAVCRRCPVVVACAEFGAAEPFGIWGGLTANARLRGGRGRSRRSWAGRSERRGGMGAQTVPQALHLEAASPYSSGTTTTTDTKERAMPAAKSTTAKAGTTTPGTSTTVDTAASRAKSTAPKDGTKVCTGACGQELPMTKFGTSRDSDGAYVRDDECRACRDTRRAAKRAEREARKANTQAA
jgi:WhiB family transcriptional regulator, redox-sensing transcriptional regulator